MLRKNLILTLGFLALTSSVQAQEAGTPVNLTRDPVYQTLASNNVYVDPNVQGVDPQVLQQAAMQGQDHPHTSVKIAVLGSLPPGLLAGLDGEMARNPAFASRVRGHERAFYAFTLHKSLNLDRAPLVLVVLSGRDDGVSVWTTALDAQERKRLADEAAPQISVNPTQGTAQLAQQVAGEVNGKEYRSTGGLWGVFLLVIAIIGGLIFAASRRKKQTMGAARQPIQALRENVLSGIEYLDGYVDTLPKNNPDSDQVRIFRQAASAKYEQAAKILDRATEMTDLNRAQGLLNQAQADVGQARRYLDRATGGTGNIPGDDAMRPQPLPDSQPEVQRIPTNQRGVSFFSSRPAPLSSLVPVTVTIGGQSRQVLVTPDEANELRQGRMPQVLAFQQGGRYVPWYEYNGYDPYNDYWRYENMGWGGFGPGLVAGFVGAELMGDLLSPGYGMGGYAPYAYATDMPMYQGYADPGYGGGYGGGYGDPGYAGAGVGDAGFASGDGGNFVNNDGGNFDTQGFDDAGGGNFMDSGGGFDTGGSDFGGGGDFSGGDSGGGGDSF